MHFLGILGWRRRARKEISDALLLLIRVLRVVAVAHRFAVEKVGHEDLVLVGGVGVGKDIGALDGLMAVPEYVINDEDGGGSVGRAGSIYYKGRDIRRAWDFRGNGEGEGGGCTGLHAIKFNIFALFFIIFGDYGRDAAAGLFPFSIVVAQS